MVEVVPATATFVDEVRFAEQAKVLRDGGTGDGEGLGDLACGEAAGAEEIEHGATGGVGESLEDCVARMCNQLVSHYA